jgi:hypothetical protein
MGTGTTGKKNEGAWIVHHADKLQGVDGAIEFQEIDFAGKCGVLLSAFAADSEVTLDRKRVEAIAKAARLNIHTDLPAVLDKLEDQKLIDKSENGIAVLGLTTPAVLSHTADIFHSTSPSNKQIAAIQTAEETSRAPMLEKDLLQWISDHHKLSKTECAGLLEAASTIGFVDAQAIDTTSRLYFNGNLFRVENAQKCEAILSSLSPTDRKAMQELEDLLIKKGCLEEISARKITGDKLFEKLNSIGVFDVSAVNNDKETVQYVTRPGAFGKFGNALSEDALDLAKAFVASLTYGMTKSAASRGRISMINALLDKLIQGRTLSPSTAAGQDYKILELKGVVEVKPHSHGMFTMRLLKQEVGKHAKQILNFGDVSEASLSTLPGASVTKFSGPEANRTIRRKKLAEPDKAATAALLNDIRTGALK